MNVAKPVKKCKDCKLYRIQCTFNTKFIPNHIPQEQRDQYIEAYYEKSQYDEPCDEYEGWQEFVEEHKITVECKDMPNER